MPTKGSSGRRSHSFGGCQPCRERHLKCDLGTPTCSTCQLSGISCYRIPSNLRWIHGAGARKASSTSDGHVHSGIRKPLYTGITGDPPTPATGTVCSLPSAQSQEVMSNALKAGFTTKSVDDCLLELDATIRKVPETLDGNSHIGPFGVLTFRPTAINPVAAVSSSVETELQDLPDDSGNSLLPSDQDLTFGFDEYLNWSDLFGLYDTTCVSGLASFPLARLPLNIDQTAIGYGPNTVLNHVQTIGSAEDGTLLPQTAPNTRPNFLLDTSTEDAQMLLRNFGDRTISHMSSIPVKGRSPYHTINLPAGIQTLAFLSYMQRQVISHAAFSNLLALLSLSSRSLATKTSNRPETAARWRRASDKLHEQALTHLRWSLETELQGLQKAKYKDQLMAILALLGYAFAYDLQAEARKHLLNCEKLLQIRGLAKRKVSRKCQLLHHWYVYVRIVGETTYVLHEEHGSSTVNNNPPSMDTSTSAVRDQHENEHTWVPRGHTIRLDDFLGFDQVAIEPERQSVYHENVDVDSGFDPNDPQSWLESRYLQLHGISQAWLSFVSQTTRLANLIDKSSVIPNDKEASQANDSLERQKDLLEKSICSFVAETNGHDDADSGTSHLSAHQIMVRALNPALVIFFNRRIRHVSSWVLQEHVNVVMRILRDFEGSLLVHDMEGPGSPWPVFIAGCEAMSKTQRDFFEGWVQGALEQTGFTRFQTMKDIMLEVWRRRDQQDSGQDWTWINVSRERSTHVILT